MHKGHFESFLEGNTIM